MYVLYVYVAFHIRGSGSRLPMRTVHVGGLAIHVLHMHVIECQTIIAFSFSCSQVGLHGLLHIVRMCWTDVAQVLHIHCSNCSSCSPLSYVAMHGVAMSVCYDIRVYVHTADGVIVAVVIIERVWDVCVCVCWQLWDCV